MPRRPSDELDHRLRAPGARDGARERMMRENGGKVTVSEAFMRGGGRARRGARGCPSLEEGEGGPHREDEALRWLGAFGMDWRENFF